MVLLSGPTPYTDHLTRPAQATHTLSKDAAAWVDEQLAGFYPVCGWRRISRTIADALTAFHPDRLEAFHRRGRHGWDVALHTRPDPATGLAGDADLTATGDPVDLDAFYQLVCQIAAALGQAGDTDPLGARKAKALGLIATGTHHHLLHPTQPTDQAADEPDSADPPDNPAAEAPAPAPAPAPPTPRRRDGTLYLHLSLTDLALAGINLTGIGIGHAERLGPATTTQIHQWLTGCDHVRVTPVLDLTATGPAVDTHDPPAWMRELVTLRDRHCVFPGCGRPARSCDLDHIDPYHPHGPPGQTNPHNLAPLCRRHHRAKTRRRWRYRRLTDGSYLWHGPHGRTYLVTPEGTIPLTE